MSQLEEQQIIAYRLKPSQRVYFVFKSALDFLFSFLGIILSFVPFLLIAFISFCFERSNPFFLQVREGRKGKTFKIIKFRTMKKGLISEQESASSLSKQDYANISNPWQRFLRKTSIDELPQVYNVFLFQMAFIGPRPLILKERDVLDSRRLNGADQVKPGLLGLSQLKGRRGVKGADKAYYDGKYVRNFSLKQDVSIFFRGMIAVFKREEAI